MTFDEIKKEAPADVAASGQSAEQECVKHHTTSPMPMAMEALRVLAYQTVDHPNSADIHYHIRAILKYLTGVDE